MKEWIKTMKNYMKFLNFFLLLLLFLVACSNQEQSVEKKELTISAAASLKDAMEAIQHTYEKEHHEITLKFNYGSSGSLKQQIIQGAPVDVFFSAAEDPFDALVEKGIIAKEDGINLLGNELVLIVPKDSPSIKSFDDLKNITNPISIGTPETVPAGQYATVALQNMNLWNDVESKIVYAKDVRQVLSYVETGNVDAGIVYKTDALISNKVDIIAKTNPTTHPPIIYPVGIIKDSKHYEDAKEFYLYLQSEEALKVFEEYGFTVK